MEWRNRQIVRMAIVISFLFLKLTLNAQYCDSVTPSFTVDLSASAQMSWVSPSIQRDGNCCGTLAPDKCLEFIITLHANATAINFDIASGAIPPGALFYQVDCGPQIPVGQPICLDGPGPHHLTFCKPGNNYNTFQILSYSNPIIGPDITMNAGCVNYIYANYYDQTTVSWTSISPGAPGQYDNLLSCTSGCDTTYVTAPSSNPPAFVDYLVCGMDANGCNPDPICDTIRVNFIQPVTVTVDPSVQHLCYGTPPINVTANVIGGSGSYFYNWSTGSNAQTITVGAGTHIVQVTDTSGCIVATDSSIITQDNLPITSDAGPDQEVCNQSVGALSLTGAVQTATGGIWSGGSGSYSPSNTSLTLNYSPTLSEISAGSVTLQLLTTGNNGCPADSDLVTLYFSPFQEEIIINTTDISCFNGTNGSINASTIGNFSPCQFSLNGSPWGASGNFSNLSAGNYTLQIMNSLGCDTSLVISLTQPPLLSSSIVSYTDILCNGGNNGQIQAQVTGGTPGYTISWNSTPSQSSLIATNLTAGSYQMTVTDANGCQSTTNQTLVEPAALSLGFTFVSPDCYGASNGAISSIVNGGTLPYSFVWNTGATSSNLYSIGEGTYGLTLTDANMCTIYDTVFVNQPTLLTGTITPDAVICPQDSIALAVNCQGGTGSYTYNWTPSNQASPSISVSPVHDQNYTCTISDNNGCSISLATMITVNYLDPNDLNAFINSNEICQNDTVILSGTYTGSDNTLFFEWQHSNYNAYSQIVETPQTSTYYVLQGVNYCNDTIFDTVNVIVNPLPLIELDPTMGNICPFESVLFSNLGDNNPNWNYLWDFGDGDQGFGINVVHTYTNSGNYTIGLTLIDNNGCKSVSDGNAQVIVNPSAYASFSTSSNSLSMLDSEFEFYNESSNATLFEWTFGDGDSSTIINPTHTYFAPDNYVVTLVANNQYGCADTTFTIIEVTPAFELFVPNAFTPDGDNYNDVFNPKGFGIADNDYQFLIFNRWGEVIFESKDINIGWNGDHNKDVNSQVGVYTWVVYFRDLNNNRYKREGHVSLLR